MLWFFIFDDQHVKNLTTFLHVGHQKVSNINEMFTHIALTHVTVGHKYDNPISHASYLMHIP